MKVFILFFLGLLIGYGLGYSERRNPEPVGESKERLDVAIGPGVRTRNAVFWGYTSEPKIEIPPALVSEPILECKNVILTKSIDDITIKFTCPHCGREEILSVGQTGKQE